MASLSQTRDRKNTSFHDAYNVPSNFVSEFSPSELSELKVSAKRNTIKKMQSQNN